MGKKALLADTGLGRGHAQPVPSFSRQREGSKDVSRTTELQGDFALASLPFLDVCWIHRRRTSGTLLQVQCPCFFTGPAVAHADMRLQHFGLSSNSPALNGHEGISDHGIAWTAHSS